MVIEEFNPGVLWGGYITLAIFILLMGISAAWITFSIVKSRRNKRPADPSALAVVGLALFLVAILFGLPLTGIAFQYQSKLAENEHYNNEAAKLAAAYPQLSQQGVDLHYEDDFFKDNPSVSEPGDLSSVISNQGSFQPLGELYRLTEDGVSSSKLVAILNEDWTVELFEASESENLVRLEPEAVAEQ